MARNQAIVIGINQYNPYNLTPLKYAKCDAELVRDFFEQEAGFEKVFFFSDDAAEINLRPGVSIPSQPTLGNLESFLLDYFEKPRLKAGDNFWFFFAGHGLRYAERDYLMPCDANPRNVERTAIAVSYVTERLRRCGADNVVLILDACRNIGGRGLGIGGEHQQGVVTIFSCSPSEISYEIDKLQQGAFTHTLLEALRIQGEGNCATVERLYQYLSYRVPQLNRQHNKPRQTPYIIAEPATKLHLILLPKYATVRDADRLYNDALEAEVEGDLKLAEQLCIRMLAVSPGDIRATNTLKRIAQKDSQATLSQPNSSNQGSGGRSPQAHGSVANVTQAKNKLLVGLGVAAVFSVLFGSFISYQISGLVSKLSSSAPSTVPTRINSSTKPENSTDVPRSAPNINYTQLGDLLAAGKWKEADEKTLKMLKVAGREQEGLLYSGNEKFPCEDLRTIDQLWVKYSNGRFGFSVQKRIWLEVGGQPGVYDEKVSEKFRDRVGWRVNNKWLYYSDLTFSTNAPFGHLPVGDWVPTRVSWVSVVGGIGGFFSRAEACKL